MNMELNNKEDVDPLVLASTNLETKINDIHNNINKKLRPILTQLNEDGEPILTNAQDKSIIFVFSKHININYLNNIFLFCS